MYLVGSLHGMSEKQIDERFDEIVDFAEVKPKFIDTPVRHYSSGMKVRLGFALISQLEHPIMLVDEVLAVGDKAFKRKCYEAIDRMLANERTMVLVSHNERDLKRFCNRGLYIKGGELALDTDFLNESFIGSRFTGRLVGTTTIGDHEAVLPTITGRAWVTGTAQYMLDPTDPYPEGFEL